MYEAAEDYGALDFKIRVNPIAIAEVRNLYAPPDHDVFELVPRDFAIIVGQIYQQLDNRRSHAQIVGTYTCLHGVPVERDEQWGYALTMARDDYKDDIELIPNLRPLHNGARYSVQSSQLDAMIDRDEPLPVGLGI
ncbi:hypothetical protein B0H14DRAFT_2643761 [Mycena olivaceomarginata]|nr:hypothetical protein B0H14DRAFT_2643761 [Mycena olivaceomarginata]